MKSTTSIQNITSQNWQLDKIEISHNVTNYNSLGNSSFKNDSEFVRLHFGLQGSYDFNYSQLNSSFSLSGHHNNIMYSNGLDIEIQNKTQRIETFGINFTADSFIEIAQNGNEPLKRFAHKVMNKENSILSGTWKTNNFRIQNVINEILSCSYTDELKNLFLLSKSIELLVLQAEQHEKQTTQQYIKSERDRKKLIDAKELLATCIGNPPTITELSRQIGINEYKLKRGFKELFGTTIFGYIHSCRMNLAKQLLLRTSKSAKEIAYEAGYSSPQHFSNAFKKEFGVTPNRARKNPDSAID